MKSVKVFTAFLALLAILCVFSIFGLYVYIGTYVLPIAPYWVTQLPPNPPSPKIKYGEFNFKMTYSINGKIKEVSDVIECKFDGFKVYSVGDPKKREWSENIKNENSYELFHFRDEDRSSGEKTYSSICIENIDNYKVILKMPEAEWFLNEPDYIGVPDMPQIRVYDTKIRYYLEPDKRDAFLREHKFEIIDWFCDDKVENLFR